MAHWNMESCTKINCILVLILNIFCILVEFSSEKLRDGLLMSELIKFY